MIINSQILSTLSLLRYCLQVEFRTTENVHGLQKASLPLCSRGRWLTEVPHLKMRTRSQRVVCLDLCRVKAWTTWLSATRRQNGLILFQFLWALSVEPGQKTGPVLEQGAQPEFLVVEVQTNGSQPRSRRPHTVKEGVKHTVEIVWIYSEESAAVFFFGWTKLTEMEEHKSKARRYRGLIATRRTGRLTDCGSVTVASSSLVFRTRTRWLSGDSLLHSAV